MDPSTLSVKNMEIKQVPSKFQAPNRLVTFMIFCCITCIVYLLACFIVAPNINTPHFSPFVQLSSTETQLEHVVFGIASDKNSWNNRKEFVRLWWRPSAMRGCVFLDSMPRNATTDTSDAASLPPICISEDTSRFRYTYSNGPRSFIRVARVVSETVALNHSNVRWFVFGDDHTVFFPENLLKTLSKYDHELWYYIGTNSENYAQNKMFSFEMAFGGAGFAISYPLAKVLAKILDSCLERYPHLYGSDGRIHACTSELGVSLTHEPGFHQMDIRGSMFGLLATHPLRPLVSIHHWEATDPIFPQMTQIQAMKHLFRAVKFDSQRIVQQTICYDRWFSWTISVSWGYAVQIFSRHIFLRDALRTQETYFAMKNGSDLYNLYSVETMEYPKEPCRRAPVFFLHDVFPDGDRITSIYRMKTSENCTFDSTSPRKLQEIRVFSDKLELNFKQLQAPRRQCCDVLNSSIGTEMEIAIRECSQDELIYMH